MKDLRFICRTYPVLLVIFAGLWLNNFKVISKWILAHDYDNVVITFLLGLMLWGQLLWKLLHNPPEQRSGTARNLSWLLLGISVLLLFHPLPLTPPPLIAFMLLSAAMLYFNGLATARHCFFPFFWCTIYISRQEEFLLLISYPFRIIAAGLAASLLQLLRQPVAVSGTSLILPNNFLAITYTCSGIQQLDVFMVLALLLTQYMHSRKSWQYLHFFFILPLIILANAARLVLTVLLYNIWGTSVLVGIPHILLGYFQLGLALSLFILLGRLFQSQYSLPKEGNTP